MNKKLGWNYKGRALARRTFPIIIGVRRFARDLFQKKIDSNKWKAFVDAIQGKAFYSQHGEDKEVYESFFSQPQKRNGFFVELGALDGIKYSNTKYFEDYLGWSGLLIEPVPEQFEKLKWNRGGNILVCAAVSEKEGEIEFLGEAATAGMRHTMSDNFKEDWHLPGARSFLVKGLPFWKILQQNNVQSIDLLSIDVEGGELEVLGTYDWTIPVKVIIIELDGYNEGKDQGCRQLLITHGFQFFNKLKDSEIWHHLSK